jgi:hypothetical protein
MPEQSDRIDVPDPLQTRHEELGQGADKPATVEMAADRLATAVEGVMHRLTRAEREDVMAALLAYYKAR